MRDGDAASYLADPLRERGYEYGGLILNYPHSGQPPATRIKMDADLRGLRLQSTDLLLLTTRPPLDDRRGKRIVKRSYTKLEQRVHDALKRHLRHCSRQEIIVDDMHAQEFDEVAEDYKPY